MSDIHKLLATALRTRLAEVEIDNRALAARLAAAEAEVERLREALRPFADYADGRGGVAYDHVITMGSQLAKRQLTMGDCYVARAALAQKGPSDD